MLLILSPAISLVWLFGGFILGAVLASVAAFLFSLFAGAAGGLRGSGLPWGGGFGGLGGMGGGFGGGGGGGFSGGGGGFGGGGASGSW